MTKTLIAAGAGAALLVLAGSAAAIAGTDAPHASNRDMTRAAYVQKLDARFAALDADRDGIVTRAEMQQARATRHDARFAKLDADGNGALSRTEYDAPRGRSGQDRASHRGHRAWMGMKDGQLTKADFENRALARFDRMDADHDGVITAAERQARWSAMRAANGRPSTRG